VDKEQWPLDGKGVVTETEALALLKSKHPSHKWYVYAPLGIGTQCLDGVVLYHPCDMDEDSILATVPHVLAIVTPRRI
jgi:hypothetical protein